MRLMFIAVLVMAGALMIAGAILAESATQIPRSFRWLPPRSVAYSAAVESGATLRDVEIAAADGVSLRAWMLNPHEPNATVMIVLHGVGAHRGHVLGHAALFARHGYTVIVPDNRAHGTSGGGRTSYGVLESGDVSRWIDWAERNTGARRIVGYGQSMGAAILLRATGTDPRLSAVAAEAPFATFEAAATDRIASFVSRPPAWFAVEAGFLWWRIRSGIDLKKANPLESIRVAMRRPDPPRVMLIHSGGDRTIPLWHSRTLREVAPGRIEYWELDGVEHTQVFHRYPEEFEERVTGFFEEPR